MSFHLHKVWNQKLVEALAFDRAPLRLLDLCAGTGEISFRYLKYCQKKGCMPPEFVLLDFSEEMLKVAQKKVDRLDDALKPKFHLIQGDVLELPVCEASFDAASVAYGIRNISDVEGFIKQVAKVLCPGGKFAIVELTRPDNKVFKALHSLYLRTAVPLIGKWACKNEQAYNYLCSSIQAFIQPQEIKKMLASFGFCDIKEKKLSAGIATLIVAKKI
jgi:ubiquinone/menaquinone biosynthesis methyltransferase